MRLAHEVHPIMAGKVRMPLIAALAILAMALASACGSTSSQAGRSGRAGPAPRVSSRVGAPPTGISLTETGSTLLFPLMSAWATGYQEQFPGVTIAVAATGSGTGIAHASAGTADIGTSDAYLSSGDLVKNPTLLNIPLAIAAQQIDYNLPGFAGATHLKLNGQVLAAMYQGTITTWDDPAIANLNPGVRLPPIAVVPIHRLEGSGDTFLFSSYLSTQDPAWNATIGYGTTVAWPLMPGARAERGNDGVVARCAVVIGCVAYVGISYLDRALAHGLGEAKLANAAGQFELPTAETISASVARFVSSTPLNETISMIDGPAVGGYPIVNYEYAIVSTHQRDPAKARAIKAFLTWVITTGNSMTYLKQVRFESLPAAVVTLAGYQIGRIG